MSHSCLTVHKKVATFGCNGLWIVKKNTSLHHVTGTWKNPPGETMTIYDLPGIVSNALPKITTMENIQKGFEVTDIYLFNRHVFWVDEFLPADVADRPEKHSQNSWVAEATETGDAAITKAQSLLGPAKVGISHTKSTNKVPQNLPSPSKEQTLRIWFQPLFRAQAVTFWIGLSYANHLLLHRLIKKATGEIKTPETLRPFKNTIPRKTQRRSQRKCHTMILTDTHENMKLRKQVEESQGKWLKHNTGKTNMDTEKFIKSA